MLIKLSQVSANGNAGVVSIRCPGCRQIGTFEPLHGGGDFFDVTGRRWLTQRRCPNPTCSTHVFCVQESTGQILRSYPSEKIDFDPSRIPEKLVNTFTEALTCHAEDLHISAAIMIRRTLEELCQDKNAQGRDLKERILALRSSVVLPEELFSALDDLRLLGNDAAHIEAKTYDSIGRQELEVAIELTKEILKAVYQLDGLVSRLRALKKS